MKHLSKYLWGIVFIILGVVIGMNSLGIVKINLFFDGWWTFFIIIPCFIGLFEKEGKWGNLIGLIIGVALFFAAQGVLSFRVLGKLIVPFIFVMIGLSFLFQEFFKGKITEKVKEINKNDLDSYVATFADQKFILDKEAFKGGNVEAIFGGVTLDLREAKLENETVIKASAIFGGITIKVPEDANVQVKATPIFGGVDNKVRNLKESKKVIYIEATAVFGGIDIK